MTVKKDAQRPLRNLGIGRLVSRGVTEEASLLLRNLGNARLVSLPHVRSEQLHLLGMKLGRPQFVSGLKTLGALLVFLGDI